MFFNSIAAIWLTKTNLLQTKMPVYFNSIITLRKSTSPLMVFLNVKNIGGEIRSPPIFFVD